MKEIETTLVIFNTNANSPGCMETSIFAQNSISVESFLPRFAFEGLNPEISKQISWYTCILQSGPSTQQLAALSLLLQFDKYNFKRSSQTALAGRLHNEHNNSPPHGSSRLVHLPLQMLPCLYVHMCLCFTASLAEAPHLLLATKRMYRGTFWTSFFSEEMHPSLSSLLFAPHM